MLFKIFIIVCLFVFDFIIGILGQQTTYNVILIAGTVGVAGAGGAGIATSSAMNSPTGIYVDSNNNIYISDTNNNVIKRVRNGIVTIFAGTISSTGGYSGDGGSATSAMLNNPRGLAGTTDGSIYVVESNNNLVRVISPSGIISTFAGSTTAGSANGPLLSAQFSNPRSIRRFSSGFLVTDFTNNKIRYISPTSVSTLIGSGSAGATDGNRLTATVKNPVGVLGDTNGNVYFADTGNNLIRTLPAQSNITSTIISGLNGPRGMTLDLTGKLIYAESSSLVIKEYSAGSSRVIAGGGATAVSTVVSPATSVSLTFPFDVWATDDGSIYFLDALKHYAAQLFPTTSAPSPSPTSQPTSTPSIPTSQPSSQPSTPTSQPSTTPTSPTSQPSRQPTGQPTRQPTGQPSRQPTRQPTSQPSRQPTTQPTSQPSQQPTTQPTSQPSQQPTTQPTSQPSQQPTTQPTSQPTREPSVQPSSQPTTPPTGQPSSLPTVQPTRQPTTQPTSQPSSQPISSPTGQPSLQPISFPSAQPTYRPSTTPTSIPSSQPTYRPTLQLFSPPSTPPLSEPSSQPFGTHSSQPNDQPSNQPTSIPSRQTSFCPSCEPTSQPTAKPTCFSINLSSGHPTFRPTSHYTAEIIERSSVQPSSHPTSRPTTQPIEAPSGHPSGQPSSHSSIRPTNQPSDSPSAIPSSNPSLLQLGHPTDSPVFIPSSQSNASLSFRPSSQQPSSQPSNYTPVSQPTILPSVQFISLQPTSTPSNYSTYRPTYKPSLRPTLEPSWLPFQCPTSFPTLEPTTPPSNLRSQPPSSKPSQSTSPPTFIPSSDITYTPTMLPSFESDPLPTIQTILPSSFPTSQPSNKPMENQFAILSSSPTTNPTSHLISAPSSIPSPIPSSMFPTFLPVTQPFTHPTSHPSLYSLLNPSAAPHPLVSSTQVPTFHPTYSHRPTYTPSLSVTTNQPVSTITVPSLKPSENIVPSLSLNPSELPTTEVLTSSPTLRPSTKFIVPSSQPTAQPNTRPTSQPSAHPSSKPSFSPSVFSCKPTCSPYPYGPSIPTPTVSPTIASTMAPTTSISIISEGKYNLQGRLFLFGSTMSSKGLSAFSNIYLQEGQKIGSSYILHGNRNSKLLNSTISLSDESIVDSNDPSRTQQDTVSRSVTVIGDINSDGSDDLMIGDPTSSRCFVYFGGENGDWSNLAVSFMITIEDGSVLTKSGLGWAGAGLGDMNGDGYDDFIVTAPLVNAAYVIYGRRTRRFLNRLVLSGMRGDQGYKVTGGSQDRSFGMSVSSVGDFNGDGYRDIVISATAAGYSTQGNVYVILGRNSSTSGSIPIDTNKAGRVNIVTPRTSFCGLSVTGVFDMNGDGFDDIAIGCAPYAFTQQTFIIYGRSKDDLKEHNYQLDVSEMRASDGFRVIGGGFMVTGLGDVNGDGLGDLMVTNYQGWLGRGNAYITVYPRNMTILLPSSAPSPAPLIGKLPSSFPSQSSRPTTIGQSVFPSIVTTRSLPTSQRPSRSPTLRPTTRNPSRKPSILPSSSSPSFVPTRKPITTITDSPSRLPTIHHSQISFAPSLARDDDYDEDTKLSIIVSTPGEYFPPVNGTKTLIISVTGNVIIAPREGRTVYTIVPSHGEIRLMSFVTVTDVLNLTYFSRIHEMKDLVYSLEPLTIQLSSRQKLILSNHNGQEFDLTEKNFIFSTTHKSIDSSTKESKSTASLNIGAITAALLLVIISIVVAVRVCSFYYYRNDYARKRASLIYSKDTAITICTKHHLQVIDPMNFDKRSSSITHEFDEEFGLPLPEVKTLFTDRNELILDQQSSSHWSDIFESDTSSSVVDNFLKEKIDQDQQESSADPPTSADDDLVGSCISEESLSDISSSSDSYS